MANNYINKKNKKYLDYIIIIVVVLLLAGSIFIGFKLSSPNDDKASNLDLNLDKYRSEDIPEECRLPVYEERVEAWKEHLSHHENTLYCLDYYP